MRMEIPRKDLLSIIKHNGSCIYVSVPEQLVEKIVKYF